VRAGRILFEGRDLLTLPPAARREVRGAGIAMVFQDSLSALNPVFPVGWQIGEALRVRRGLDRGAAMRRAVALMERVRIPDAAARAHQYPHQFSGGQRQRVMIAMSLALDPQVLIADEPTTALDVTVQAQIMDLLMELKNERGMALVLITHDLGVVAQVADRIAVMYAGRMIERSGVHDLYARPAHPYTRALLESIPGRHQRGEPLTTIRGLPPNLLHIPPGCPFHPRCPLAVDVCRELVPPLSEPLPGRFAACHRVREVLDGSA
jgi:oligopeptide/dipeptide ABC transporter ATP-binding protein